MYTLVEDIMGKLKGKKFSNFLKKGENKRHKWDLRTIHFKIHFTWEKFIFLNFIFFEKNCFKNHWTWFYLELCYVPTSNSRTPCPYLSIPYPKYLLTHNGDSLLYFLFSFYFGSHSCVSNFYSSFNSLYV